MAAGSCRGMLVLQQLGQWIREGEGRAQAGNHDGSLGVATVRVVGNGEKMMI